MKNNIAQNIVACGLLTMVATASAAHADAVKDIVTDEGVFTVPVERPVWTLPGDGAWGGAAGALGGWFHDVSPGIGQGVALSTGHTWAAVRQNDERLVALVTDGDGTPLFEVPSGDTAAFLPGVAAARDADRAAYIDDDANGHIRVRSFTSAGSEPDWEHIFDPPHTTSNFRSVAVSRDGSVIAAGARDGSNSLVIFFDAETGDEIATWTSDDGTLASIDLTDDGSIAMVSLGNNPRVVDGITGDLIWEGTGSGAGNVDYRISGDGSVIAVGGFSLQIYEWDGSTYQQIINFTTPVTEWFGFGKTISRDGSTVGSMSRESASNTLHVRMWDVQTKQMLGEETLPPVPGTLQTGPHDADATDDGSVFAFATWGDGTGVYPEIQVYNRDVELIAEIDMPGSAWGVAITPNAEWVVGTGKAVHANTFGSGGQVVALQLDVVAVPGDLTGDGTVGVDDLLILLAEWGLCADCADCPADLTGDCTVGVDDLLILLANWG